MNKKNISLIGFMGTGKTTIGKILAERIGYKFIDVDEYIVKTEGKPINEIFEKYGEDYFRDLETKAIKKILKEENQVISTGGGARGSAVCDMAFRQNHTAALNASW